MNKTYFKLLIILISVFSLFEYSKVTLAVVNYELLAPIPNQDNVARDTIVINEGTLEAYFKNLYRLGIVIATGLAVLMIMWGGIEYITTDAMGGKEEAKERISSAIMGLLLALGSFVILRTIDPNLVSVKLDITGVDLSQVQSNVGEFSLPKLVQAQYTGVYGQWTEADQTALEAGDATALNKWNGLQSQINALNSTYKTPASGYTDNVGPANQKVLALIRSGYSNCTAEHCSAGTAELYRVAGVTLSGAEFQQGYKSSSGPTPDFGTPRMPVPGETVDYRFYEGNSHADPFHSVIVESIRADGSYAVWDWGRSSNGGGHNLGTGFRIVNFNLNNPSSRGYIGRVYTPR